MSSSGSGLSKDSLGNCRRAAFDIGSGATKLLVADIRRSQKNTVIIKIIFGQERPCAFGADWLKSSDGNLSLAIQKKGIKISSELMSIAQELGASSFCAIATEVFRKSNNGESFLNELSTELSIPIHIVAQELEAELGYSTGVALRSAFDNESETKGYIVWDSGGASFQITYRADNNPGDFNNINMNCENISRDSSIFSSPLQFYVGAYGSGVAMKLLVESIQKRKLEDVPTPNPVPPEDAAALISTIHRSLPVEVPDWLRNATVVTAIGGPNSVFYLATRLVSSLRAQSEKEQMIHSDKNDSDMEGSDAYPIITSFTLADIEAAVSHVVGRDDQFLQRYLSHSHADPPSLIIPKLALLNAVLLHTGIRQVQFVEAIGSCAGVLITEKLWSAANVNDKA